MSVLHACHRPDDAAFPAACVTNHHLGLPAHQQQQPGEGFGAATAAAGAGHQQLQQLLGMHQQPQPAVAEPACPEGRSLYNRLVSELSMAGCEAALEHMAIRCPSNSSTTSSAATATSSSFSGAADGSAFGPNSRHNSITSSGPVERAGSGSAGGDSNLSTGVFQDLLLQMLQEEWAAQQQHYGSHQHQCPPQGPSVCSQ